MQPFSAARRERMPQRWGGLKDRRASLLHRPRKRRRIFDDLSLGDDDTGATDEGKKQLESRDVEPDSCDGHQPISVVKANLFPHRQKYVVKAAMSDGDALGGSGGA